MGCCGDSVRRSASARRGGPAGPIRPEATASAAGPAVGRWLYIAFIAAIYIGFAVADGRTKIIAVEITIAAAFLVLAAVGVTGSVWLMVAGYAAHGFKDLWQHRTQFVAGTRWSSVITSKPAIRDRLKTGHTRSDRDRFI